MYQFIHSYTGRHLCYSCVVTLLNKAPINICAWTQIFNSYGKLRDWFQHYGESMFSFVMTHQTVFCDSCHHFTFLPWTRESYVILHVHQVDHCDSCAVVSHYFNFSFIMTCDVNIFSYANLSCHMYSLVRWLFRYLFT